MPCYKLRFLLFSILSDIGSSQYRQVVNLDPRLAVPACRGRLELALLGMGLLVPRLGNMFDNWQFWSSKGITVNFQPNQNAWKLRAHSVC